MHEGKTNISSESGLLSEESMAMKFKGPHKNEERCRETVKHKNVKEKGKLKKKELAKS